MELKNFIGKVVVSTNTQKRYTLWEITAPYISVRTEKPGENGYHSYYSWETISGDPISRGILVFEDAALTEPFKAAYEAYSHTEDAYWERYGYWMRKD